ncbi:neurexin-3-like [Glandiceps talaboti]
MQKPGFTIAAVLLSMISISSGLEFYGTYTCYAQYEMWDATTNGTLSFQFKTSEKEGLLAYMDDGGQYDFLELKVTEGHVRLRFRIGDSAQTVMVGDDVNDNTWHTVEVIRNYQKTTLVVDSQRKTGASIDQEETTLTSKSDLFFGGIPRRTRLTALALPSVMFDTRFKGHIRNIFYGLGAGRWKNPNFLSEEDTKEATTDVCPKNNPCLNNGLCISNDLGATCDCAGTGYEGETCKLVASASVSTFDGQSYFSYDLSKKRISSQEDSIQFEFRTQNPNGLILQSGYEYDYVYFGIEDGELVFAMNLGSGPYVGRVSNNGKTFSDNKWHKVVMTRKTQEITIDIDAAILDEPITLTGRTVGSFASFTSDTTFYVGGAPDPSKLYGSTSSNGFVGCLKEVIYYSNSLALELSTLARKGDSFISISGDVAFSCQDVDPVTFITPEAYIAVDKWDAKMSGSLSYRFRTNEPNGVLMYNNGEKAMPDYFAMELLDGYLNMILDLGSGTIKMKCHRDRLDDGQWHFVRVERFKREGSVQVDDETMPFRVSGNSDQLDLEGSLFIGGIDDSSTSKMLPREMWSGMLGYGFVGCMRDLNMNGKSVDLADIARSTAAPDIGFYCESRPPQCNINPCRNGGICSEGWNRFICDCSSTRYIGETCFEDATTVSFDGTQYLRVLMQNESRTEAEEISLRFKTQRAYGLLMATTFKSGYDTLMLELDSGKVKLQVNLGDGVTELFAGEGLNDMEWHTVNVVRKLQDVSLAVDDEEPIRGSSVPAGVDIAGNNRILEFSAIEIGALSDKSREDLVNAPSNFLGHMEQFILNDNKFFEMAKKGTTINIVVTATFDNKDDQIISDPVTFKSAEDFVMLSPPDTYPVLNIFFQFRTVEPNGLILFNEGDGKDFLAVELVDGYIQYVFNTGDKTNDMRANTVTRMNNNQWHEVTITRDNRDNQVLKVDDATTLAQSASSSRHIDLTENMRVGGMEAHLWDSLPEKVLSRSGYLGCLASLDLNGKVPDLIEDALNEDVKKVLGRGCEAPSKPCAPDSCQNRGECYQMWNDFTCDCDMTTYTGEQCEIRGTRATFGKDGGIVTFTYPEGERPGPEADMLALGFRTKSANAVLARIDSDASKDFIELEIDGSGTLFVVYNLGGDNHPIGDITMKVNDGKYHVVRFYRNGGNSTLQIDGNPVIKKTVTSDQLRICNAQTFVKLGARGNTGGRSKRELDRSFVGTLQGVNFNGIKVLDLGLSNDPRVEIDGDVRINEPMLVPETTTVPRPNTRPMIPKKSGRVTDPMEPTPTDDDIYIEPEPGSGCDGDDEDDCDGSGDERTPKPVKPPTTTATVLTTTPSVTTKAVVMTTTPRITTMMSTAKPTIQPAPVITTPMMPESTPEPVEPEGSGMCDGPDDEDCNTEMSGSGDNETEIVVPEIKTTTMPVKSTTRTTEAPLPEPGVETTIKQVMTPVKTQPPVPEAESTMKTEMSGEKDITTKPAMVTPKMSKPPMAETEPMKPDMTSALPEANTDGAIAGPMSSSGGMGKTAMVVGIVAAVCIAVLILLYAIYKYRNRNEGSYRIDESRNYSYGTPSNTVIMPNANGTLYNGKDKDASVNKPLMKKQDSREWYV